MEIQQLRGFQAVAKYRNFTIAAKKTQRTQPTISLQIKALEEELGVMLFERLGPKKVTLTPEGQIFQEITAPVLQDFNNVITRFNEARGIYATSSVKIVTHSSVMIYLLPQIVKKFKLAFPDCHLTILNRSQQEILAMLDAGEADFGITSMSSNVPAQCDYKVFSRFSRILIATKNHPLAQKSSIGLEDIAQYPLVLPTPDSNTRKMIDKAFQEKGLTYDLTMEVVGRTAIKTYVDMELGISIINEYYVTDEDKKRLFVKNMSRHFGKAETGIVVRKGKTISHPAKEFMKMITKHHQNT
jgi:DNA-binding transcriptional LysR family regulator